MTAGAPNESDGADLKQEFRDLLRASGWSQAEASRQLAMTPSALSQIVRHNSPVRPSPVTLRLFQLLLWREKPEAMREAARRKAPTASAPWEREVIQQLRGIPPRTRDSILRRLRVRILAVKRNARAVRRRDIAPARESPHSVKVPGAE
jgi:transcriptional regulator with XRE-family HTH domain